ncbi:MAG: hypothetical protein K1X92_15770 [Bacteroidia bacterium]|nr:hypothetical protein [Bacteroidia bacterium]
MKTNSQKTTNVKIHKTAEVSHIRALTEVLERVLKGLSRDILFEVSDNGFITFRNYGLLRVIPGASLILNEAGAIGAAKLWMKQFNEWRMGQREGFAGYPANAAANFPDFFHKRLEYRNAVPVYKEEGSHKILHYWKVNYGLSTAEGAAIADHTVTLHVRHSGGGLLVGLDYHALPLLGETEETESALPLTDEQLKKNLIYRHNSSLQMYLPHLITETGVVPLTRLGAGVERNTAMKAGVDYTTHINLLTSEIHFFTFILYNKNDKRLQTNKLNLLWENVTIELPKSIQINKRGLLPSLCGKWSLYFNCKFVPYESEYSFELGDETDYESNKIDLQEIQEKVKNNPEHFVLSFDITDLSLTNNETHRMIMSKQAFKNDNATFSHEYGHSLRITIDDSEIITLNITTDKGSLNPLFGKGIRWTDNSDIGSPEDYGETGYPIMSYLPNGEEDSKMTVWDFEYKAVAFEALYMLAMRANGNDNVIKAIKEAFIKRCSNIKDLKKKVTIFIKD